MLVKFTLLTLLFTLLSVQLRDPLGSVMQRLGCLVAPSFHVPGQLRQPRSTLARVATGALNFSIVASGSGAVQSEASWLEVAEDSSQRPELPRSGHCSTALPAGSPHGDVLIFGGYTETDAKERQATNEVFVFKDGGWQKRDTPGAPRARIASQAVTLGSHVYVIGGWDPGFKQDGGEILKDVAVLSLDTLSWQQAEIQGGQLLPTSRSQAVAMGDHIWLHTHRCTGSIMRLTPVGGAGGSGAGSASLQLQTLPVAADAGSGETPPSRGLHSLTAVGSTLYLFGGAPQSGPMLDDLWSLDTSALQLVWKREAVGGRAPSPRCSHSAAAVGSDIVFHGGAVYKEGGGLQALGETFVLDTAAGEWRWPHMAGAEPPARNAATMDFTPGGQLLLHGGWVPFVSTFNDTWLLPVTRS